MNGTSAAKRPLAGLLPLYLKLYDEKMPDARAEMAMLAERAEKALSAQGVRVEASQACRTLRETEEAIAKFESVGADAIISLHLAYSPSLESASALVRSKLPLIMLDATPDYEFTPSSDPGRLLYNHGIHGVQDLASVLRREGKPFQVAAGHIERSNAAARAASFVKAANAAKLLGNIKALRLGKPFQGMGDFQASKPALRRLGVELHTADVKSLESYAAAVGKKEIDDEMEFDSARFEMSCDESAWRRSTIAGLALRRMLDEGGFDAFSMNFTEFGGPSSRLVSCVPFAEASKAMSRGTGYAGEGDVLTASLAAALARSYGRASFTEIFCPNWKDDALFLSHMGEANPEMFVGKGRLVKSPSPFAPGGPAVILGCFAPGPATFVNIAPAASGKFRLIASDVELLQEAGDSKFKDWVRGWMRPASAGIASFLERFSKAGGTHHSVLIEGSRAESLSLMAEESSLEFERI